MQYLSSVKSSGKQMTRPTEDELQVWASAPASFARYCSGGRWYPAKHLVELSHKLMDVAAGDINHLMIFMPPRHGKSELTSKYFPAWYLGKYPDNRVILTGYEADFAAQWGYKARNIMHEHGPALFNLTVAGNSSARDRWDIAGHLGGMSTAGVGGAITGKGAHCLSGETRIHTNFGMLRIDEVVQKAKYDERYNNRLRVLAYDHRNQRAVWKRVKATRIVRDRRLLEITTASGDKIRATDEHRFFVHERGYTEANRLCQGDRFISVKEQIKQNVRPMWRSEGWPGCTVHAVLPEAQDSSRSSEMFAVWGDIRNPIIRLPESTGKKTEGLLLFSGVFSEAPCHKECKTLCRVCSTDARETEKHVLFHGMPGSSEATEKESDMSGLWGCILPNISPDRALFKTLRQYRALKENDGSWKFSLQDRDKLCEVVRRDEATRVGERRTPVCHMWQQLQSSYPPYKRKCCGQHPDKLNINVPHLPHHPPQIECDTVSSVTKVSGNAHTVYDIQVEDCNNFFAENILVHNCLIIDDPIKNAEEANSKTYRDKSYDWYRSTAYTRIEPGGSVVIIQCMTGDTPVLMADGSEHQLSDIRKGDMVATYDTGKLSTSRVLNHTCSGKDIIYKVVLSHGKQVRANERHPFLAVEDGKLKWIRLKDLTTDHTIVILKDSGVSGKERLVWKTGAKSRRSARDIVCPTTIKRNGQTDTDPLQVIPHRAAAPISNTGMVLQIKNLLRCLKHRMANVLSASNLRATTCGHTGEENCVLTTTTIPGRSGHYYVTIVTSRLHIQKQNPTLLPFSNTSNFTTVGIERIATDGREDVFDVEIERTGNFIANGVVSNNTRWHEDDLSGRLLKEEPEKWTVINLPALAEEEGDQLGRQPGEALFPKRYDVSALLDIKRTVGSYWWNALYQQRPAASEGAIFKRQYFQYCYIENGLYVLRGKRVKSYDCTIYQTCDPAVSTKASADYFVLATWAVTPDQDLILLDILRTRLEGPDQINLFKQQYSRWKPAYQGIEAVGVGKTLYQMLVREGLPIRELKAESDKVTRALPAAARMESGSVYFMQDLPGLDEFEEELLSFPKGKHDDQVDCLSYAVQLALQQYQDFDLSMLIKTFPR